MRNPMMIGERLYLRPMEASDGEAFAAAITMDPETFFERGRFPASPLGFEQWVEKLHKSDFGNEIAFAVTLRADDQLIGMVGTDDIDWINRTGETGSFLFPDFRGQGYGPEAKHLLLEYCFDHIHLHALTSHVWEPNTRSAAALGKQGYRPAGRWKWDDVKNGVYRDTLVFDLLRDDWLAARDAWRESLAKEP